MHGSRGLGGILSQRSACSDTCEIRAPGTCMQHLLQKVALGAHIWALVHTALMKYTNCNASQITGKDRLLCPGSQPSTSRPQNTYHKFIFCWMIRKCTGQLSTAWKLGEMQILLDTSQRDCFCIVGRHVPHCILGSWSLNCPDQKPGWRMLWLGILWEENLPASAFLLCKEAGISSSTHVLLAMTKYVGTHSSHIQELQLAPPSVFT